MFNLKKISASLSMALVIASFNLNAMKSQQGNSQELAVGEGFPAPAVNLQSTLDQIPDFDDYFFDRVYVHSNEERGNILKNFKNIARKSNGNTIVGVSGFEILNIASQRRHVDKIIVLDANPLVIRFWIGILELIKKEASYPEFLNEIHSYLETNSYWLYNYRVACELASCLYKNETENISIDEKVFKILEMHKNNALRPDDIEYFNARLKYFSAKDCEEIKKISNSPNSWLFSPETYKHIRQIALNNGILIKLMSLANEQSMSLFGKFLTEHDLVIDTFYISNVAYVTELASTDKLLRNIAILVHSNGGFLLYYSKLLQQGATCYTQKVANIQESARQKSLPALAQTFKSLILTDFRIIN